MFDVCNSLKDRARNIFITSFHANKTYIESFIENNKFEGVNLILIEVAREEDEKNIKKIIGGQLDDHAGNTEISNMLVIDQKLVKIPPKDYLKIEVKNPFETDNLIEKCPNGIVDNHPQWIINKRIGKRILDIYITRMIKNLKSKSCSEKSG